ncbi:pyridoxamine 5'-phosphate oxidase family protein, partial [Clostridium cadaveris]|nr:pyridoxamine 5'-phosphate oxidase family protein [Clostridium cadaveris]
AFTTIPSNETEHVRVNNSTIQKSNLTIFDLKDEFIKKISDYETTITEAGDYLSLYELHFNKATVTLDYNQSDTIPL